MDYNLYKIYQFSANTAALSELLTGLHNTEKK